MHYTISHALCMSRGATPRKNNGQRHRERDERVEVIEGHREVEEVRRDRAGQCRRHPPGERPTAPVGRAASRAPRRAQPQIDVAEEDDEEQRGRRGPSRRRARPRTSAGPSSSCRSRTRSRPRSVKPQPEERMRVDDLRNEVVDREVRRARRAAGLDARPQHDREVAPARIQDVREHEPDAGERQQRARVKEAPVRQREHEQPNAEARGRRSSRASRAG